MSIVTVPDPPCGTKVCAELLANLVDAIEGRDVIGMAKGILMQAEDIGPEEAFQVLVKASQRENKKLRQVAHDLVEHRTGRFEHVADREGAGSR